MQSTPVIYIYNGCSTCRNAVKWLKEHGVEHTLRPIREQPPSVAELRKVHKALGSIRKLFNSSGNDYRALGLKERLAEMDDEACYALLSSNGNLVKRPFVVTDTGGTAGFKEEVWREILLS